MLRIACLLATLLTPLVAAAENIQLEQGDMLLNAQLETAGQSSLEGQTVVLIGHGTLAHGRMDVITTLQETLAEYDLPSLAPTLSLGISNREGMYDCSVPHRHRHQDAVSELKRWFDWLTEQQPAKIILLGHSRGGNQIARLSAQLNSPLLQGQVLLAPMTWHPQYEAKQYEARYGTPLKAVLQRAEAKGSGMLDEPVGFLYCEDAQVDAASFLSYYQNDGALNTPALLTDVRLPTLVIAGSEDQVVPQLPSAMQSVQNPSVEFVTINGADHFFRDLFAYDVVDQVTAFMDSQP